jgi:hypothetical protein
MARVRKGRAVVLLMLLASMGVTTAGRPVTDGSIADALTVLQGTPSGQRLLTRALSFWNLNSVSDLSSVLLWGPASKTDAVLTRHFNPTTGEEQRSRRVTIYLRKDQPLEDLTLDLSHELVHATSRPAWDPYDPDLTLQRYLSASIEGTGGEVEAVLLECQVGMELARERGTPLASRCGEYVTAGKISRRRVVKDFYRVGRWHGPLLRRLGQAKSRFPLLSDENPKLYSSTGRAPYPYSLVEEFDQITQIACENSRRRGAAAADRAPASGTTSRFLEKRCPPA